MTGSRGLVTMLNAFADVTDTGTALEEAIGLDPVAFERLWWARVSRPRGQGERAPTCSSTTSNFA